MKTWIATLLAGGVLLITGWAMAGDMTPPAGPDQPTMNTLQEIHDDVQALEDRLNKAPPPRTGQEFSAGEYNGGDNDDGSLQKGVPWPDPRFTDNGDGTVTDHLTGLIWLKQAECIEGMTWEAALDRIYLLEDGQCGLSDGSRKGDWRLPNINEMHSLFDFNYYVDYPSLPEGHPFSITSEWIFFWTSTSIAGHNPESFAWVVESRYGNIDGKEKTEQHTAWAVRGGMYGQ